MTKEEIEKIEALLKKDPKLGRRRLSAMTGVSVNRMQAYLCNRKSGTVKPAVSARIAGVTETEPRARAISLADIRVSDVRPQQDQIKRRLCGLKRGVAFPVEALAEEWGVSEENLRKNARKMECLKYVEVRPFDWVHCVMNPDTAEQYNKERS